MQTRRTVSPVGTISIRISHIQGYFRYPARADFNLDSKLLISRINLPLTNLHVHRELEWCGHVDHVRVGYIHKYRIVVPRDFEGEESNSRTGTMAPPRTSSYIRRKIYYEITFARESLGKAAVQRKIFVKVSSGEDCVKRSIKFARLAQSRGLQTIGI